MVRILKIFSFVLLVIQAQGQPDSLELIFQWDDPSIRPSDLGENRYNEVFGFVVNDEEYAVIGSTKGAHIFSLEDNNERQIAFVEGSATGTEVIHRDFDVYRNYLYMVSDQGQTSTLQIVDLSRLPDKVELVYDTNEYIIRSHNVFIDQESKRLYSCGGALSGLIPGLAQANDLSIYSLEDPANPKLLLDCREQLGFWRNIGYIHDIYVRNDTAYCNAGPRGMFVVDFTSLSDVKLLGSLRNYDQKGYNHQGYLHPTKPLYAMTDETHGMDIKLVDVSNFKEMEVLDFFSSGISEEFSVPHNVIFKGDYLYVSYYYDGVYVFDVSDPRNVKALYYYDTNEEEPTNDFNGCWGVYPSLPSGKILASDMINGLFVFWDPFKPKPQEVVIRDLKLRSNLVSDQLVLQNDWGEKLELKIFGIQGNTLFQANLEEGENVISLSSEMGAGWYNIQLTGTTELKNFRFYKFE